MIKKFLAAAALLFLGTMCTVLAYELPILMYHSIDDSGGRYSVTEEKFRSDIDSLVQAGYTTVLFEDVIGYVYRGESLPEKSVVITFDDGYKNNYDTGFKIAKEKNIKFEMFGIVGFMEYSPLAVSWDMAREMEASGLVNVGAHSFNLHSYVSDGRMGVTRMSDESYREWESVFRRDLMYTEIFTSERLGHVPQVFAYPYGKFCVEAERALRESGYLLTVSAEPGINIIKQGDLESLYLMMRISMDYRTESAAEMIESYRDVNMTDKITECKNYMWTEMFASRADAVSMLYAGEDLSEKRINYSCLESYIDSKYLPADTKRFMAAAVGDFIVGGFPDYTLGAGNYITRGEFAVMLSRKMNFSTGEVKHKFSDTAQWNENAVSWCAENGYMIGYGDKFGTDDFLTKQQLGLICERIKPVL